MTNTEIELNIYQKLTAIQNELKVEKTKYNKFANFWYRTTDNIFSAVKPLLLKYNTSLFLSDSIEEHGTPENMRFYVKAVATIVDNETGEKIEVVAFAKEPLKKDKMDESQTTGSASTYARKYALNGLFALDDVQDPDSMDNSDKKDKVSKVAPKQMPDFQI